MSRDPYVAPVLTLLGNIYELGAPVVKEPRDMIAGVCRICGCTDEAGCVVDEHGDLVDVTGPDGVIGDGTLPDGYTVCSWVEPDLCSACVVGRVPALLVDGQGKPLRGAP